MIFIQADYGKAESWIVAAMADDERMLAALRGPDFHSENASNMLEKIVTKANEKDRQLGKRTSHAANYRMTAFLLQKVLLKDGYAFTKQEAAGLLDKYFAAYPNIRSVFHTFVEEQLKRDRTLTNYFGRKTVFWDRWDQRLLNMATAWVPQGTVGDLTNRAFVNVYNNMGNRLTVLNQVHDSLVMQTKESNITQEFLDEIKENMNYEFNINGHRFVIPIDFELGYDWYHLYDWEKVKKLGEFSKEALGKL